MSVLWSVLAGIGTVLMFLLKGVGILLLAVLVLGLLLMFCPFCADVQWAEGIFQVKAGALGITFPVFRYPAPSTPPFWADGCCTPCCGRVFRTASTSRSCP